MKPAVAGNESLWNSHQFSSHQIPPDFVKDKQCLSKSKLLGNLYVPYPYAQCVLYQLCKKKWRKKKSCSDKMENEFFLRRTEFPPVSTKDHSLLFLYFQQ